MEEMPLRRRVRVLPGYYAPTPSDAFPEGGIVEHIIPSPNGFHFEYDDGTPCTEAMAAVRWGRQCWSWHPLSHLYYPDD